jgi:predicted MFS family arabinose efflux permease
LQIFKSKDGLVIFLTSGVSSGVNGVWGAMLVYILMPYYSQWDIQWLGLFNILAGVAGGLALGKFHDHYHHFKLLMCVFFFLSAVLFAVISLGTQRIVDFDFIEILALNVAVGITINAIYPVSFEALIEVTYPVKEEVSAGLIALANNAAGLVLLLVGTYYTGNYINWTMTGVCVVCFIAMLFTKEAYKRTKIDLG